jgi:hypothetical protein
MQKQTLNISYLITFIVLGLITLFSSTSCQQCYTCTGQTDFGEVEREICGRKGDISPLVTHLQSDTNPWSCVKQ